MKVHFWIALITCIGHILNCLGVLIVIVTNDSIKNGVGRIRTVITYQRFFANKTYPLEWVGAGTFDIPWAIFAFFAISALAQCSELYVMTAVTRDRERSKEAVAKTIRMRYVEYSVSAAIMLVCIAVEVGMCDVIALILIAVSMFATNLFGLAADIFFACKKADIGWIMHIVGWITVILPYMLLLSQFQYLVRISDRKPPDFVYGIVFSMAVMFCSFGIVQFLDFWKWGVWNRETIAQWYDILSLVAKTLLGWLVLGPVLSGVMTE